MSTEQPGSAPARNCVSCGRSIAWDANVCPYCGHDFRAAMAGPAVSGEKKFKGSWVVLILLLLICWPAAIIYFFYKRD